MFESDEEYGEGDGGDGEDSDFSDLWSERVKARNPAPPPASKRPSRQKPKVTYFDEDEDEEDDFDTIVLKWIASN